METESYEELKNKYDQLLIKVDEQNQQLYECRRVMKSVATVQDEYQEEIRAIQNQFASERDKLQTKIQQLESANLNLKIVHTEEMNNLEKELQSKVEANSQLRAELEDIIRISEKESRETDAKLLDEFFKLKEQNLELCEQIEDSQETLKANERQNMFLQEKSKQLEEELESFKENLKCKREELEEKNTLIQTLKDDYLCVKSELDKISSIPHIDESKGNSLFAEVDDRRLKVQQNMKLMKEKYLQMKEEHAIHLKKITLLRNENATLMMRWKHEIVEKEDDQKTIKITYEEQIRTLKELIESYKDELKQTTSTLCSTDSAKYLGGLLGYKSKEIEDLRQKLFERSHNYNVLAHNLADSNAQVRKYNLEVSQLKNEIGQLQDKLEEVKLNSPTEKVVDDEMVAKAQVVEEHFPKPIIKSTTATLVSNLNENKENEALASNKKVQFSAEAKDDASGHPKIGRYQVLNAKPTVFL